MILAGSPEVASLGHSQQNMLGALLSWKRPDNKHEWPA
jgi:hypothetical protein